MKIEVIDAVMGTGKSTWAMEEIKNSEENHPKVIVVPFLSEVKRYYEELEDPRILALDETTEINSSISKLAIFKAALGHGQTIITTHSLFQLFDPECFELIEAKGYELLLDETAALVAGNRLAMSDFQAMAKLWVSTEETTVDHLLKVIPADNIEEYDGEFQEFVSLVKRGHIFLITGTDGAAKVVTFVMPPEKITSFTGGVKVLTYMFKGTETEAWFKLFKINHLHLRLERDPEEVFSWSKSYHNGVYSGSDFDHLINMYLGKYNLIGNNPRKGATNPLSATWYKKASKKQLDNLKDNLRNIFSKVDRSDLFWTCPKIKVKALRESHFSLVSNPTWLAVNTRATNNYASCHNVAICQNLYPLRPVESFFNFHGIHLDKKQYALSMMVQFIFRSAIRNGEEINLYLPSERMRNILNTWLDTK